MSVNKTQADIGKLRSAMYRVVERNAKGLDGPTVVRALKKISEDMFEAGIDEACREAESKITDWNNIADAWDLTYLTLFAVELKRLKVIHNVRH